MKNRRKRRQHEQPRAVHGEQPTVVQEEQPTAVQEEQLTAVHGEQPTAVHGGKPLVSAADLVSVRSAELRADTEAFEQELRAYYIKLAEAAAAEESRDEEKLKCELEDLAQVRSNLKHIYQRLAVMADELGGRMHDLKVSIKRKKLLPAPQANFVIDLREQRTHYFAEGLNFYKLFLLFFLGSFVGVLTELAWCLIKNGYLESRSGLMYGPFNILYGAAAVLLTLALYRLRNHGNKLLFVLAMLVCTILEYFCSWGQEFVLGSRSWDYSEMPFNINGRVCLLYSLFWGLLGIIWIKNLYPRIVHCFLKIPDKVGKAITRGLAVFMAINILVTAVALGRWYLRLNGSETTNPVWSFVDERFPDERMERVFSNMEFGEETR